MYFGPERGHQLSVYATGGGWGIIQNVYSCNLRLRVLGNKEVLTLRMLGNKEILRLFT